MTTHATQWFTVPNRKKESMTTIEEIRERAMQTQAALEACNEQIIEGLEINVPFAEALEAWLREYDPKVLPIAAREMRDLNNLFEALWNALDEGNLSLDSAPFVRCCNNARDACLRNPPELAPRCSVAELHAAGISTKQIAYEWRLFDKHGKPDEARVLAELADPGSIITSEYIKADNRWRLAEMGFTLHEGEELPKWRPWQRPKAELVAADKPPGIEQMIRDGCFVSQIVTVLMRAYPFSSEDECRRAVLMCAKAMRVHLHESPAEFAPKALVKAEADALRSRLNPATW